VIPRLIGILESNGRSIKPCLIHGDLWETNIGTDIETGNIYIFDAAAYYGHNEMETGIWRVAHHRIKAEAYRKEYVQHYEKSEPVEEWDDRLKLYGVKTKLMYSAGVLNGQAIRRQ
jgi:protein-ribulosamine 3-kinase